MTFNCARLICAALSAVLISLCASQSRAHVQLKDSTSLDCLRPPMVVALVVAADVYRAAGERLVVTSACDYAEARRVDSLHPLGLALDLRLPSDLRVLDRLALLLGPNFDVVVEPDHAHVEYDPT